MLCIICGVVYDKSCFERLNNTHVIGEHMVICLDHDITSNCDDLALSEDTRRLFVQLKSSLKVEVRKEILEEMEEDYNNQEEESLDQEDELRMLKRDNKHLKLLNEELKDKNNLLKDYLAQVKQGQNKSKLYSQVLIEETPIQKRIPKIVVKKKNRADGNELRKNVTHYLNKDKTIQTKKVIFKNDNEIIISCMNETSAIETEKSLHKKLSGWCTIEKEVVKKPRIKVVGIDNYEGMDLKAIEDDINTRNFKKFESKCTAVHTYVNKKSRMQSVIIEVSSEIYKHIRENKNRIFVGYQNCKVYDDLNLQPCFNCGRFGHNGKKCENERVCLKCAGPHSSVNCNKSEDMCCVNCVYSNNVYNTQFKINHVVNDSKNCQVLINRIKKYIAATDYPMSPIYQRYIGKIDIANTYANTTGAEFANKRQVSLSSSSLSPRSILGLRNSKDNSASQQ